MPKLSQQITILGPLLVSMWATACQQPESRPSSAAPVGEAPLSDRERFERKRMCMELGVRKEEREAKALGAEQSAIPATYCYSEQMKTCLYSGGYIGKGYGGFVVVDLLTNKELAAQYTNGKDFNRMPADFQQRSEELLRTCVP